MIKNKLHQKKFIGNNENITSKHDDQNKGEISLELTKGDEEEIANNVLDHPWPQQQLQACGAYFR